MTLVWPAREYLPGYIDALERGWSPDHLLGDIERRNQLERIAADADHFLASLVDRQARGDPIKLPDGSTVPRLPGFHRWIWDGQFCGRIGFRWQPGTEALPAHCLGHIGYSVVPWKQRRGYATRALRELLPEVRAEGLRYVVIAMNKDNVASRKVVEANGGVFIDEYITPPALGAMHDVRYRIYFTYAAGRKYSTIAAPIDASTKPT